MATPYRAGRPTNTGLTKTTVTKPTATVGGTKPFNAAQQPVGGQQQQPGGILGGVLGGIGQPITGGPQVTPAPIVQAPDSPAPATATGPMQLGYTGQRVNPGSIVPGPTAAPAVDPSQTFNAPDPSQMIDAPDPSQTFNAPDPSQTFQMDPNAYRAPTGTYHSVDPNSGQYFGGQINPGALPGMNQFRQHMDSLEDATYQRGFNRINPQIQDQQQAISQRLMNSGLPVGSEAYNREMDRFEQSSGNTLNDLALGSVGAGRQEHSRLTGLAAALQGQDFGQQLSGRQFDSGEAQRRFAEVLSGNRFNASESARQFGEGLAGQQFNYQTALGSNQFNAGEAGRGFREGLAGQQFNAGEAGRNFGERGFGAQFRAGEQGRRFGEGLAGQQFNAGEAGRNFGERSQSTNDAFGRDLAARGFRAGEQGRNFNERFAGENQYFGQQQAGDQFAANRAQFGDQFNAGQQQQNYQNQFGNANFMANQYQNQFGNSMANRQNWFGEQQYNQNAPLQQLSQLLGLAGGVQNPYFQQTGQFAPQNVPYMQYRQGQGNQLASLIGGGIGAASMGFM